jgi:hypothetical protein
MVKMVQQEGEFRDAFRLAYEGAPRQILLEYLPHPLDVEKALALSMFSNGRSSTAANLSCETLKARRCYRYLPAQEAE